MSGHHHHGGHARPFDSHGPHDGALTTMLDMDAKLMGGYLTDVPAWLSELAAAPVRSVADIGAGTGVGAIALARAFPDATVTAYDVSAPMLAQLTESARAAGVGDRVAAVEADLDTAWPQVDPVDLVWASGSVHHFADPDEALAEMRAMLNPGSLVAVLEKDSPTRLIPADAGEPGLEARVHEVLAAEGWNVFPDWQSPLVDAGFEFVETREFPAEAALVAEHEREYGHSVVARMREAVEGRVSLSDLAALDALLDRANPAAIVNRDDAVMRNARIVWVART